MPSGGLLIDVPGIRELRVAEINGSIDTVFGNIDTLSAQYKFADCNHQSEPGCAVRQAVETGKLDCHRLSNYKKLLPENALATKSSAEEHALGRDFAKNGQGS